jgi:hypothetical protein
VHLSKIGDYVYAIEEPTMIIDPHIVQQYKITAFESGKMGVCVWLEHRGETVIMPASRCFTSIEELFDSLRKNLYIYGTP